MRFCGETGQNDLDQYEKSVFLNIFEAPFWHSNCLHCHGVRAERVWHGFLEPWVIGLTSQQACFFPSLYHTIDAPLGAALSRRTELTLLLSVVGRTVPGVGFVRVGSLSGEAGSHGGRVSIIRGPFVPLVRSGMKLNSVRSSGAPSNAAVAK